MKQYIVRSRKETEIKDEHCDNQLQHSAAETDAVNIYRLACTYSSPFMPMIDITFALEELMKIFKNWLAAKKKGAKQLL
ncbi:uncharacterized protein CHSO_2296 [Chryseobacterium sp. StRB126]|uniref:hypothetical protein n=1 Tax=Chryseobacterium sp. StRB126 TaxID=878220 RepID=UPI0004E98C47|nr:hypothetical protein [Chryseobacterium sp. StRB126]BAP31333.1 uncharacterized protein CHSO_2296 [Chryseobacterium sp. StRB126]